MFFDQKKKKNVLIKVHWLWVRHHMQNLSSCNYLPSLIILSFLDFLHIIHLICRQVSCNILHMGPTYPPANHSESFALGPTTEYLFGNFQVFLLETFIIQKLGFLYLLHISPLYNPCWRNSSKILFLIMYFKQKV